MVRSRLGFISKAGFTLIELLVVIGIIGVLATISVASLNSARQKARDARRLTDLKQIQASLISYFNDNNHYPDSSDVSVILGSTTGAYSVLCSTEAGFQTDKTGCGGIYMDPVPGDPKSGPGSLYEYKYKNSADKRDYTIEFIYESGAGGLPAGDHKATQNGLE